MVYFRKGGNKMKKNEKCCRSELKHLFTIHLFTFFPLLLLFEENKGRSTRYKHEKSNKHTIMHGCNPTKQGVSVEVGCSLEIKWKMENLFWSELKHLFTYSPIHLFTSICWLGLFLSLFFFLSFIRKR